MGAKSSKPVAQAKFATRKFPTRPAGQSPAAAAAAAAVRPPPRGATPSAQSQQAGAAFPAARPSGQQASFTKDDAIRKDGSDPDFDPDPNHHTDAAFSQRLRQMGVATPNPTLSNSSIVNAQGSFAQQQNSTRTATTTFGQNPSLLSKQQPSPPTSSAEKPTSPSSSALGRAGDRSRPFPATTSTPRGGSSGSGRGGEPNSTAATTLNALEVRKQLAERARHEFERGGNVGREFLDVNTLRQIIALVERRQRGSGTSTTTSKAAAGAAADMSAAEAAQIEKRLKLKAGVVGKLVGGKAKGVFGTVNV